MPEPRKITGQQARYVIERIRGHAPEDAAYRAGVELKMARARARGWLKNALIGRLIREKNEDISPEVCDEVIPPALEIQHPAAGQARMRRSRAQGERKTVASLLKVARQAAPESITYADVLACLGLIASYSPLDLFEELPAATPTERPRLVFKTLKNIPRGLQLIVKKVRLKADGEVQVELYDKQWALDRLGDHLAMWGAMRGGTPPAGDHPQGQTGDSAQTQKELTYEQRLHGLLGEVRARLVEIDAVRPNGPGPDPASRPGHPAGANGGLLPGHSQG